MKDLFYSTSRSSFQKRSPFSLQSKSLSSMKRIYILGVNGNARDVLEAVRLIRKSKPDFPEVGGFLDDRVSLGTSIDGVQVCGTISSASKLRDALFINAIGSPESYGAKPSIIAKLGVADDAFISIVHPMATVSSSATLGLGCAILSQTSIGSGVKIGRHVMVLQNCVISHDAKIEDFSVLATGVCLSGDVHIGKNAYLGSQSCVRSGLKIGEGALLGIGSVLLRNIPPGEIWCGNPAKLLRPMRG